MQAAVQYATRSFGGRVTARSTSGEFASSARFIAATIELYSRLWQALEDLGTARSDGETERLAMLLRLELVLLQDALADSRCRSLLRPVERNQLSAMAQSIHDTLSVRSAARLAALAQTQNELFDAIRCLLPPSA